MVHAVQPPQRRHRVKHDVLEIDDEVEQNDGDHEASQDGAAIERSGSPSRGLQPRARRRPPRPARAGAARAMASSGRGYAASARGARWSLRCGAGQQVPTTRQPRTPRGRPPGESGFCWHDNAPARIAGRSGRFRYYSIEHLNTRRGTRPCQPIRSAKCSANLARVGKALSSPTRIEYLELLAQAERSVERARRPDRLDSREHFAAPAEAAAGGTDRRPQGRALRVLPACRRRGGRHALGHEPRGRSLRRRGGAHRPALLRPKDERSSPCRPRRCSIRRAGASSPFWMCARRRSTPRATCRARSTSRCTSSKAHQGDPEAARGRRVLPRSLLPDVVRGGGKAQEEGLRPAAGERPARVARRGPAGGSVGQALSECLGRDYSSSYLNSS